MISDPRLALAALSQKTASMECFEKLSCALSVSSVCEVCVALFASIPEVFLTPLCVVCQWLIRCWMGSGGPLTRSYAKNSISFCWVRLSTRIGFLKGKVYFPLPLPEPVVPTSGILIAYQEAVCIFGCPTCLNLSQNDSSEFLFQQLNRVF